MMYKENFVVVIKHRGKILRERNGFCTLPFGAEYNILLKNLEARKAVVKISVDNEDVLDGNSIVINANSNMELKGFMKGTKVTNKFRFIQKTKEIVDHRGDKIDDGIVRVEFKFEKKRVTKIVEEKKLYKWPPYFPWYPFDPACPCCGFYPCRCVGYRYNDWSWTDGGNTGDNHTCYTMSNSLDSMKMKSSSFNSDPIPDEGITVKGSKTNQNFTYAYTDELEEQASVLVIKLRGVKNNGTVVEKPLTVKTRLVCPTCGRKNRSTNKFCHNCGTYLE